MDWNEPTLAQYEFDFDRPGRILVARLGFPRFLEAEDVWACSFQLDGYEDSAIQVVQGEDGLQALVIAIKGLRKALDGIPISGFKTEPYQFVFPRFVPVIYGLDFHLRLCNILDEKIREREDELTRLRETRQKPKPKD
jgi:hypothetical protein